jgi:16S rRNA (adenine1518-N6/adenine1519-N6)-dimethyltransferase
LTTVRRTIRPKLGQHFLSDAGYRRRIVEALGLLPDDLVLEIGAGRGAMTNLLAERVRKVVALELDSRLADALKETTQLDPKVEVREGDILSTDLAALCRDNATDKCFVFGNLPYYITSPIVHHLFGNAASIRAMGLLVQREVAERLTAAPGSPAYGYLSVLTQLHSEPRIVLGIPPGAFSPHPKVQSALVVFRMASRFPSELGAGTCVPHQRGKVQGEFLEFIKRCFAKKRKNLVNNLVATYPRQRAEEALLHLALPTSVRAEQLTLEQFAHLFITLK